MLPYLIGETLETHAQFQLEPQLVHLANHQLILAYIKRWTSTLFACVHDVTLEAERWRKRTPLCYTLLLSLLGKKRFLLL